MSWGTIDTTDTLLSVERCRKGSELGSKGGGTKAKTPGQRVCKKVYTKRVKANLKNMKTLVVSEC